MQAASEIMNRLNDLIIKPIILLVFAAGFFLFMWGLVTFLWNSKEGEIATDGKQHMLWGVIGVFIMVSVLGIISIIQNTFGIGTASSASTDVSRAQNIGPTSFGNLQNLNK